MAATQSPLDHAKTPPPIDVRQLGPWVASTTGKSLSVQRREMRALWHSIGMLTEAEYYYYGLYDDSRFSAADKARFIGLEAQNRILTQCTDRMWWGLLHDKLVFQHVLQGDGIAMPRIEATYHRTRTFPGAVSLPTQDDLARFLRADARYPLFGKPFDGMFSVGSARFDGYDGRTDRVSLHAGDPVPVAALTQELTRYAARGYLFQEVKHPEDTLRAMCGDRLACLRVVVMLEGDRPEVFRTLLKVPTGAHVADNFWRKGNMLANVDIGTGRIIRVVTGVGPDHREVDRHPDTGQVMVDRTIPRWDAVTRLCLDLAPRFPWIRMQAWDIAVCPEGPVVVEANVLGDFNLPQLATGAGILDGRFARFLRASGYSDRTKLAKAADLVVPAPMRRLVGALRLALH